MDMPSAIQAVIDNRDLSISEMKSIMRTIMTGEATPAQIGGFLVGLRIKGETVDEIASAAQVMRELATHVEVKQDHLVDTCGTGGDASKTFNISTASAFVVAAAGGRVAKHGNRSVSSKSGSADVLEAAGVKLDLSPEQVALCVDQIGVGFMFAPMHHNAMKHAIGPRREMRVRTLFNLLGPLTNPANAPNQVLGVYSKDWIKPLAEVLGRLGSSHVLVVHAEDGMDEFSISSPTHVAELKHGEVMVYTTTPEQFGIQSADISGLKVENAEESLVIIKEALQGKLGLASNIVALNAGAAIYAAGLEDSLQEGIKVARDTIISGKAMSKLEELVELTQSFS